MGATLIDVEAKLTYFCEVPLVLYATERHTSDGRRQLRGAPPQKVCKILAGIADARSRKVLCGVQPTLMIRESGLVLAR